MVSTVTSLIVLSGCSRRRIIFGRPIKTLGLDLPFSTPRPAVILHVDESQELTVSTFEQVFAHFKNNDDLFMTLSQWGALRFFSVRPMSFCQWKNR